MEELFKEKFTKKDFQNFKIWDIKTFYKYIFDNKHIFADEYNELHVQLVNKYLFNLDSNRPCKNIKIDEKLSTLLEDTKNKVDTLQNMPFQNLFILNNIYYKNFIIKGLNVFEVDKNIYFSVSCLNTKTEELEFFTFEEEKYLEHIKSYSHKQLRMIEFCRMYFNNFLDLLNSDAEIEQFVIKGNTHNQNMNRLLKNKYPKNDYTIIKPTNILKRYVDSYSQTKNHAGFSHRFIVRGHFRNLTSDRFKNKNKTWVKPYIKGQGLLINKEIHVEQD